MYCVHCGASTTSALCESCEKLVVPVAYPICVRCGRTVETGSRICPRCSGRTRNYDGLWIGYRYAGPVRSLVRRWKFRRDGTAESKILEMMEEFTEFVGDELRRIEAVVSVPTHFKRWTRRGFNQSAVLARVVSDFLGVSLLKGVFVRRNGDPVSSLGSGSLRRLRTENEYDLKEGQRLPGRVALVDDVFTSGATADRLAGLAKLAGAEEVVVITFAGGGVRANGSTRSGRIGEVR